VDATVIDGSSNAVSGNAVFDALALKAPLDSPVFTGSVTTSGDASIYTSGTYASIASYGTNAHIATYGAAAYIQSRATFKLSNGTHTTTLSHAPTANRSIAFPNATGTVPVYTGTPATGQVLTASGTAGLTNWTSATSAATADTLVLRDASGGGVSFQGGSGDGANIQSTSGRGVFITSQTATGAEIFSDSGTGADILSGSGTGARIESLSGTGANIIGSSGTYHAQFGNSGINQSFIARVKGALGWIRGAYTGRIHPPDTLTADRTYTLPDDTGTIALINPSSGTQTFSGAQIFDSTTRPTSSGTGTPAPTSLITRSDLALEALEQLPVPLNWGGTAGTANSSGSIFGSSLILAVTSAAVVGNFRESQHALGSPMNRNGSGANIPFLASRFSTLFEFTSNGIASGSNEIRFLFGVGNVQTLSAAGLGLVINSNTTVKLQIHNGTSLQESANITIPQISYICRMFLSWDGAKIVFGFANSFVGVIPRMTKIAEFSHSGAIPSLCGDANWKIVNIATGTAVFQHTLYLRSAHYTPYVIALP
jgi:hypothetical protein